MRIIRRLQEIKAVLLALTMLIQGKSMRILKKAAPPCLFFYENSAFSNLNANPVLKAADSLMCVQYLRFSIDII